ncbi:hypothetical protein KPATCC21470_0888 [Kitasatospora purpeofusca]
MTLRDKNSPSTARSTVIPVQHAPLRALCVASATTTQAFEQQDDRDVAETRRRRLGQAVADQAKSVTDDQSEKSAKSQHQYEQTLRNARRPENRRAPCLASQGGRHGARDSSCDGPSDAPSGAGTVQSTVTATDASFKASSQVSAHVHAPSGGCRGGPGHAGGRRRSHAPRRSESPSQSFRACTISSPDWPMKFHHNLILRPPEQVEPGPWQPPHRSPGRARSSDPSARQHLATGATHRQSRCGRTTAIQRTRPMPKAVTSGTMGASRHPRSPRTPRLPDGEHIRGRSAGTPNREVAPSCPSAPVHRTTSIIGRGDWTRRPAASITPDKPSSEVSKSQHQYE